MAAPNTGGQLKTKIQDMQVGDYIKLYYATYLPSSTGNMIRIQDSSSGELPSTGINSGNGDFYMIKVDKGLLISDRVVHHSISWDSLNNKDVIQGLPYSLDGVTGIIRSLGGGNSYATADGKSSTTDTGNGAWPVDNEWDTYIVKKDYGTGAGRDDVWHALNVATFVQETPMLGITTVVGAASASSRVRRGFANESGARTEKAWQLVPSDFYNANTGFRPVFEYQEVA